MPTDRRYCVTMHLRDGSRVPLRFGAGDGEYGRMTDYVMDYVDSGEVMYHEAEDVLDQIENIIERARRGGWMQRVASVLGFRRV